MEERKEIPLVSVLMTAYNREQYIGEAIESVLSSDYTNFELIIVDDASTDRSAEIAKTYAARDPRISVYINGHNLRQFPNRNYAASLARGEFIMWVDSDDTIAADSMSQLVAAMSKFPEAAFGMYAIHGGELRVLEPKEAIQKHFFEDPFLTCGPGGTFIKREYFLAIGGFPVNYGVPGDMFFNLSAACRTSVVLFPFQFVHYRIHEGQELNNFHDIFYNKYRYMRDALRLLPLGLTPAQTSLLQKKNNRRFIVTIFKYIRRTHSIRQTVALVRNAEFGYKDFLTGLFH